MVTAEALVQVKAFARQDGFILALVWIGSMTFLLLSPGSMWGSLMALSTPFFVGWRLGRFRDYALEGYISFRRALCYSCYCFFYASLIFAVAQFVYFRYLDNGTMMQMFDTAFEILKPMYMQNGFAEKDLNATIEAIHQISPADLTFTFMMQNLTIGAVLSLAIAAICKRTPRRGSMGQ